MTEHTSMEAVFGFTGFRTTIDGIPVTKDMLTRIQMPASLTSEHLGKARKDAEVLLEAMSNHPEDVNFVANAVLNGNVASARDVAAKLGITEARLIRQGGGYLWLVIAVIAVAAALTLESDTPPTPETVPSNAGAPNAGPG